MSTIAGFVDWRSELRPSEACSHLAAVLAPYGSDSSDARELGDAVFVRSFRPLLPEDEFDHQPLILAGGQAMLVADVRIDNRREVEEALGWSAGRATRGSDSDLLADAWTKWGEASLDKVLGDFALAVWNVDERKLTLARSAMALKPLFYHQSPKFWAFGSMPAALHALPGLPKELDFDSAAAIAAKHSYLGSSTIFANVRRVEHGQVIRLAPGNSSVRRFWEPRRSILGPMRRHDYVDCLRAELDRAVGAQLRRARGPVASQLSAGRDSSAVTATAARLVALAGESLLALTGAPSHRLRGQAVEDRLMDESELAGLTAAMHPNVRHVVTRPDGPDALDLITAAHRLSHGPLLNPTQIAWWHEMHRAAAEHGASIMLSAGSGNFGISAGGPAQLRDMLVDDGLWPWLRTAIPIGGLSWRRWRNIASVSFGPSLPQWLFRSILRATGRSHQLDLSVPTLRPPYRQVAEGILHQAYGDPRPLRSFSEFRREMLLKRDASELLTLAQWGVEPRDPTADRRLIEFCLSLPNDLLVSGGPARPLYEAAMADRIPAVVLTNRRRGYQSGDWFLHFTPAAVRDALRKYGENRVVAELLDLRYLDALVERWPRSGWERLPQIYEYRGTVIGTLALADFLDVHFR